MSEIRTTTSVELLRENRREPYVCLAQMAVGGTALAAQTGRETAAVAGASARSALDSVRGARNHSLRFPEVTMIAAGATTAREALVAMAAGGKLEIPRSEALAVTARLEGLVARNDVSGVVLEIRSAITARQERIQGALVPMVVAACEAVGYRPVRVDARRAVVEVRGEGGERGVIDVAKDKTGGVKLHFDTDGFEGDECRKKLVEPVIDHLRSQGAEFSTQHRRPKRPPVCDRGRVSRPARNRTGR